MIIAEARSFSNGIDFFVKKKEENYTLRIIRNEKGIIQIFHVNLLEKKKTPVYSYVFSGIIAVIYLLVSLLFPVILQTTATKFLFYYILVWILVLLFFGRQYFSPAEETTLQYHAAEHKVLNYIDKYSKAPDTVEKAMKMSSISYRCGSTLINFLLLYAGLVIFTFLWLPYPTIINPVLSILAKIFTCIVLFAICFFAWLKGYCNLLQRLTIKSPTKEQVELAVIGIQVYLDEKSSK